MRLAAKNKSLIIKYMLTDFFRVNTVLIAIMTVIREKVDKWHN